MTMQPSTTAATQYVVLHVGFDDVKDADTYGPYATEDEAQAYADTLDGDTHVLALYPQR
jgi:hypothetical protein